MFTPHVGFGHYLHLLLELVMFSLNVGIGNYLHIMLELVIVYTSCLSLSLLTPHVGVGHC